MGEDDFEMWLGRIGKDPGLRASLRRVVNLAGAGAGSSARSRFTGGRIGRGSGIGRLFGATRGPAGDRSRRVVVKARIVNLAGKGLGAAAAHLRYLQRDGTTREGERGMLYGADRDNADGKAFLERGAGDRHQFRFIVAPEDAAEYDDLRPLTRRLMAQVERDLGTRLDWVAVDHFNTGHPHTHVLLRGRDALGKDLVIAREYIARGLRERAAGLVTLDLGPRSDREIADAGRREIAAERFTGIDHRLLRAALRGDGTVAPHHRDRREQALRAGRIGTLARMGLATKEGQLCWRLHPDLEAILRDMGRRGDIIAMLGDLAKSGAVEPAPVGYLLHDPADARAAPVVGRVAARGLAGEMEERTWLLVDGIDGRAHYVDIGSDEGAGEFPPQGAIVRIAPAEVSPREVDRTVAAVAEANRGFYAPELHALHDPSASERHIAAHVRRLEALRRRSAATERGSDGLWRIAPDYLARASAHDRAEARYSVRVEILARLPLDALAHHDGITALDEDPDLAESARLGGGFGRLVADALRRRQRWLEGEGLSGRPDTLELLRRRERARVAMRLSRDLGMPMLEAGEGGAVRGIYRQSVEVGMRRMAVIEGTGGFALVPWRQALERHLGREVSGVVHGRDVDWSFGRQRGRGLER